MPVKVRRPGVRWVDAVPLAVVDVFARLAVPAALGALAHLRGTLAVAAALAVVALSFVRGVWTGHAVERSFRDVWGALVEASGRRSVVALRSRPKEQSVPLLLDAAHEAARYRATVLPRLLANTIGLVVVSAFAIVRLGFGAFAVGVGALASLGILAALLQRRLRRARSTSWERFAAVARDVAALLDAAAELRAHGRQPTFVSNLLVELRSMARAERQATTYSVLLGLFPLGVALVGLTLPLRGKLAGLVELAQIRGLAEVGLLGATALVLAIGLLQTAEEAVRAGPCMRLIAEFLNAAGPTSERAVTDGRPTEPVRVVSERVDLRNAEIVFDRVSIVYAGSADRTPAGVTHRWRPGSGLAVTGRNGAGKSSLALAFLGLLDIAEGEIRLGQVLLAEVNWGALATKVVYLPQQAFVAPAESVAWHLRLLCPEAATPERIEQALRRVGLYGLLEQRAAGGNTSPLDVLAGELSGGQLRRLQLARAFVGEPDLIVLDEPEAGLDGHGRAELRKLLASLATTQRVLLIAHDPTVIPEGFDRIECTSSQARS